MSQYQYSPIRPEPGSIRLLRLMPNEDEIAPIQCRLFDYSLQERNRGTHLYEALSYAWGGSDKSLSIFVDGHELPVTANLHAALSHLRNRSLDRAMWVDAVCINQADSEERGHQVQSMAKIYANASRVIVWLGEAANDSDRAFEEIRVAAEKQPVNHSSDRDRDSMDLADYIDGQSDDSTDRMIRSFDKMIQQAVFAILQRPWFRRIWVLQEVAAARSVLVICGSAELDGFAFCLGLKALKLSYEACPGLQNLIRSVVYLMRAAIFRSKYISDQSDRASLNIRPLGGLVDMYHTHESTERHDKIFALLGMCSDDPSVAGLTSDYNISWEDLFQQLIKFILCNQISVETLVDREMAIIESKGRILGWVSSVEEDDAWDDRQNLECFVSPFLYRQFKSGSCKKAWETLHTSAKNIHEGDIICLLQGASKPMIVRICEDYLAIIVIAVTPEDFRSRSGRVTWQNFDPSTADFPHNFLLVWDWSRAPEKSDEYEKVAGRSSLVEDHSTMELGDHSHKTSRLWNIALICEDLREYKEATRRFQEIIPYYEAKVVEAYPRSLTVVESIPSMYEDTEEYKQWQEENMLKMRIIMIDILKPEKKTASSVEEKFILIVQGNDIDMIKFLLERRRDDILITEKVLKAAAKIEIFGGDIMALLLDRGGNNVPVTEEVVEAAADNGMDMLECVLERVKDVPTTEKVLKTAARKGIDMVIYLLERIKDVSITEEVLKAAAGNAFDDKALALLLSRGNGIPITEEVVKAGARSTFAASKLALLLGRGDDTPITEEILKAAASNDYGGAIGYLLERDKNIPITDEVLKAAARNTIYTPMEVLLEQRGHELVITKEVINAAVESSSGEIAWYLKVKGYSIPITRDVAKRAAVMSRSEVLTLLRKFDHEKYIDQIIEEIIEVMNWYYNKE